MLAMRRLLAVVLLGLSIGAGIAVVSRIFLRERPLPSPPAVATQIREVARLETLEVRLYKKVSFEPEPTQADSLWGDVAGWLRHTLSAPKGKAIVFADAFLTLDLERLNATSVGVQGRRVDVVLPPIRTTVAIRPGETEILGSNLDSAETARLLDLAKVAFEREVDGDAALKARARASAERHIRALLLGLGFGEVRFVDALPPGESAS
jgi:uncharacterized protein DUF4230